ncbi:sensor histidine kinase [Ancylomarina sp. 16SWW S1-10-2]|uniref:sensor histidine kinase n=1 Tax=Ancylomarina sp. 16SWW S1-10-2 TaxID=2499681 RepID=UPI00189E7922|nr:sensor histidine kinase [Ancylomarina sp. 16SWW S1-10-2]
MVNRLNWDIFYSAIIISSMYCFGLAMGSSVISTLLDYKFNWQSQGKKRLVWGIIITVVYVVTVILLIDYYLLVKLQNLPFEHFFKGQYLWMHLFYIVLSLGISAFFHAKGSMQALKVALTQKALLENQNIASQYEALKNQVDPHFLFNSLNVLSSLVDENPATAHKFINRLSYIYRYVLDQKDKELVSIEEELDFAEQYVFLQKIRFEEGVNFSSEIDASRMKDLIIPLAFQILLENIFKHNIISDEQPIFISIKTQDDYLVISNNINKKSIRQPSHNLGLENIKARYKYFTNADVIIDETPEQFCVKLPLIPNL